MRISILSINDPCYWFTLLARSYVEVKSFVVVNAVVYTLSKKKA